MKKMRIKFITVALASTIIAVGYSAPASASADSVAATTKTPDTNPSMIVTTFSNVEFQGGSTVNGWYFWMNSGPYTIFRNKYTGEYRTIQTQGTISYMLGVIASGWGSSWKP
ncbi:hypothetical protein LK337_1783 [Lactococcus lactis subsp. lactis]|nr:hypothetical protein LK337_1783 [Lactococcus lactis subsp. lactis]